MLLELQRLRRCLCLTEGLAAHASRLGRHEGAKRKTRSHGCGFYKLRTEGAGEVTRSSHTVAHCAGRWWRTRHRLGSPVRSG